jgi:hypothetical protein
MTNEAKKAAGGSFRIAVRDPDWRWPFPDCAMYTWTSYEGAEREAHGRWHITECRVIPAGASGQFRLPESEDCRTVCRAAKADGVTCPDDSCDIEDKVRQSPIPAGDEERLKPHEVQKLHDLVERAKQYGYDTTELRIEQLNGLLAALDELEILRQDFSDLQLDVSSDGVRLGLVESLKQKRIELKTANAKLAEKDQEISRLMGVMRQYWTESDIESRLAHFSQEPSR